MSTHRGGAGSHRGAGWGASGGALSYQPHTSEDVDRMLAALGLDDVDQLFQPIPSDLRAPAALDLPRPHAEQEVAAEAGAGSPPATGTWTS